jgi:hypothetical protein
MYPKAPLLDATTGRLTTACVKALLRIFLMCDRDGVRCVCVCVVVSGVAPGEVWLVCPTA